MNALAAYFQDAYDFKFGKQAWFEAVKSMAKQPHFAWKSNKFNITNLDGCYIIANESET